ncbi:GNAT family N-acetyltransferase [Actinomadura craniellae]|uniref:GNAT family N-acetyltransferase n=1 Tax=Actinomadura craniellae TaxID=2231787 RepID=A0A365GWT1_9ACTN|nr:GNAT family N-acetyltransferase [Actinomadura craniellae]RAY11280.1 GNAT family N-acetyltransferase [Actinomadura craniellae]
MTENLTTDRLVLRGWRPEEDAAAAFAVYGAEDVARWLTPAMERVADEATMRSMLEAWIDEEPGLIPPYGHWALARRSDGQVVGGLSLRPLPPYKEDIEIAWQLAPAYWGQGYATEAARALADWAFSQGAEELFAVVRPANDRAAAMARRVGMEWTGESDKYYDLHLQVYRLRPDDLVLARRRG